jgi:PPK2 family polyphosphate:nucleotide phosphotransferase
MIREEVKTLLDPWRVKPGAKVRLASYQADWAGDTAMPKAERKRFAELMLSQDLGELRRAQDVLYASNSWSILVVLQAMDAAGKDALIKHVMSGVNPAGCQVFSFKQPSTEELDHDFLWRAARCLPERGRIGIFNRSYYEEVLVVKVHPALVERQGLPNADPSDDRFWGNRYESINNFERHLSRNGTRVLKFYLHVSNGKQHERLLKRLKDPDKHWKFSAGDLAERNYWDQYMQVYEQAIEATSTKWAPWHIIPADHKWVTRALVAKFLATAIDELDLKYPVVTSEQQQAIDEAYTQLDAEMS